MARRGATRAPAASASWMTRRSAPAVVRGMGRWGPDRAGAPWAPRGQLRLRSSGELRADGRNSDTDLHGRSSSWLRVRWLLRIGLCATFDAQRNRLAVDAGERQGRDRWPILTRPRWFAPTARR